MPNRDLTIAFLLPGVGIINRGAETFVLELADQLIKNFNCKVTILTMGKDTETYRHINGIPRENLFINKLYSISFLKKILDKFFLDPSNIEAFSFSFFALFHLLRNEYSVLLPSNGIWGALTCCIIRKIKRTPFITVGHAGIGRPDMWQVRMRPNVHVVLTQHAYDWVKDLFPEQKVVIIPNGIDPSRFHPNIEKILLALEHPIFLCAAALIPYKNINLTIDAVASLQSGSLLVLGTGALEKEIKDYGNRKLGENRFLLKAVAYADIPPYFASCDVFTLASEKECEAFGIVYLEAMACNKPVVATDDPIRLELIADAGFLCDGYDVEKYSQNLLRAVHENFGDKPRQRAESFSWYFVARKYRQLLEKIIFEMETNLSES